MAALVSASVTVIMSLMTELTGSSQAIAIGMSGASNQLGGGVLGTSVGGLMLSLGGFTL